MAPQDNPFLRGYQNLRVSRILCITCSDDHPPLWRPLHPSQVHLTDEQVIQSRCRVGRDFAIVLQGNTTDVERAWPALEGIVRFVTYSVVGDDFGQPVHVGDAYSLEAAREVMRRLTFETGLYSRCWEISCAHLSEAAYRHLEALADSRESRDSIIAAFRIPGSPAIGIKLIATPWTDANLHSIFGLSAHQLRQEHIVQGMPPSLADVLHLAGQADVRMLVFDADARRLDGLAVHDT
ncbi:DUF5983 family protein [Acidovorax sp. NCPPB 3576]|uniref:DUF5983 family protein n=1 Tax=Acidovorax sp. NCPPB 3576 TaxID=2940488 RepID=UPI002349F1E5|nr:ABC transporter substrate-binding protein [Acidovorax sp. NCPPB 3576]WCM86827.1 ABC transporter substrate-binding protein [Acidovorax sp. NCPPB 3576]